MQISIVKFINRFPMLDRFGTPLAAIHFDEVAEFLPGWDIEKAYQFCQEKSSFSFIAPLFLVGVALSPMSPTTITLCGGEFLFPEKSLMRIINAAYPTAQYGGKVGHIITIYLEPQIKA